MTDVYAWIDPFEEQARAVRAERRAATAYADGQRAVLRDVAGPYREKFERVMELAVHHAAERIARDKIAPHMAKSYEEHREREYRMEREIPEIEAHARPLAGALRSRGNLALAPGPIDTLDASYVLTYEVVQPFRFSVSMSPFR